MAANENGFSQEEGKALLRSKVFWGTILTAGGAFLPEKIKNVLGSPGEIVDNAAITIGILLTLIGRIRAEKRISSLW